MPVISIRLFLDRKYGIIYFQFGVRPLLYFCCTSVVQLLYLCFTSAVHPHTELRIHNNKNSFTIATNYMYNNYSNSNICVHHKVTSSERLPAAGEGIHSTINILHLDNFQNCSTPMNNNSFYSQYIIISSLAGWSLGNLQLNVACRRILTMKATWNSNNSKHQTHSSTLQFIPPA